MELEKVSISNEQAKEIANDYMEEWNFENCGIKYWSQTKEFLEYVNKGNN